MSGSGVSTKQKCPHGLGVHKALGSTVLSLKEYHHNYYTYDIYKRFFLVVQGYRIFNTWMGDPARVVFLEEILKVIKQDDLFTNTEKVGNELVSGMEHLQV